MQILSGKLTAKQEFSGALHRILNQRRVPRGHVSIRNPLQAPKERSCGISITSPSLGSAKRDRLSSSTSQGMCQSPFGELYLDGGDAHTHSCAASQLAVGFMIQVPLRGTSSSYSICCRPWVRGYGYANIVQRVKICYKIKIDYRVPVCCFYGVLLCKQHPRHTIAPLLQSNSATIRV